jgi:membrane protease YdiL (CAAX protease family)
MRQSPSRRSRHIWVVLLLAPLLWVSLWWVITMLAPQSAGQTVSGERNAEQVRPWITVTTNIGLILWMTFWLWRSDGSLSDIGLKADWLGREALIGVLAGGLLWVVGLAPLWLLGFREWDPVASLVATPSLPIRFIQVSVVAVCEEIIWRGYVMTELHRFYRLSTSVVIAVIAFTTFYLGDAVLFDWLVFPLMLYLGGCLSLLYLWRRSLIAPIVARFVFSGLGLP